MAGLLADLLDLIFPPRCVVCRRPGAWFCPGCLSQVEWIVPPLCPHCGEPLRGGPLCPRRGHHLALLDGLRSAAWYDGGLRVAIHQYKYRGLRALAEPLGDLLLQAWRRDPPPVDLLMPVPLHARRSRERGFNQAALLAHYLSRGAGLSLDTSSLRRIRYTSSQVDLSAGQRLANVQGAFAYCGGPSLEGRRVCLIDDICTTGATLQACAAALREAGAGTVWAFTLARPKWQAQLD